MMARNIALHGYTPEDAYSIASLLRRPRGKRRPATTCMRMRVRLTVQSLVHEKLGHREGWKPKKKDFPGITRTLKDAR